MRHYVSLDRQDRAWCEWRRPDRYRGLFGLSKSRKLIAHGSALSLTGAGFAPDALAVDMTRFNRLLNFDAEGQTLTVEAGATLAKVLQFLLPRGFTLPIIPGYPHLSVGGCIAGNVHGKNQYREGCFIDSVVALTLFHPHRGPRDISREIEGEVFDLTCGGFGLTGIIVSATLRIDRNRGSAVSVLHLPVKDIETAVGTMLEHRQDSDFLYSWHDFSRPDSPGRGFVIRGSFEGMATVSAEFGRAGLRPSSRWPRIAVLTPQTLPLFNKLYAFLARRAPSHVPLGKALFPFLGRERYFDFIGEAGLIEHQVLVPFASMTRYITLLRMLLHKHGCSAPLVSLKIFGGQQRLLRYCGAGVSLSLHFFNNQRARRLLGELDQADKDLGVITNLLKDSRISAATARAQYREFDSFRGALHRYDPCRLFTSILSQRLDL